MKNLIVSEENNLKIITLNRPQVHNAFNQELILEMTQAFKISKETRAVIIRAQGPSFCAGADMNWMKSMVKYTREENILDSGSLFAMMMAIYECEVPVIARVHGNAIGGGVGIVCACDIAIGLEHAKFGFTEVKLGIAPAVISPFVLNKMNWSQACRYFLSAELFSAKEAEKNGILQKVFCTETEMDLEINTMLTSIRKCSPSAQRAAKKLLRKNTENPANMKEFVISMISDLRVSAEGQEGLNSFLEKKNPSWSQ